MATRGQRPFVPGTIPDIEQRQVIPRPETEGEQAAREAATPPVRPGQDRANQFFKDVENQGKEESGLPDAVFHGASVDPADIVGMEAHERKFIGRSGMRQRFGTDMAIGRIDARIAADYGINLATEEPAFMLMNDYGGNGQNFEDEWLQNNPDGRIPTYQGSDKNKRKGEPYRLKGMVLGVIPREVMEEIRAENKREVEEVEYKLKHGNPDLPEGSAVTEMRDRNSAAVEAMLRGSPTNRRTLDEAMNMYSPEDTQRIREDWMFRHAPRPQITAEAAAADKGNARANAIDRAVETAKAAATGKSSFAVQGFKK